jgi:hypothetical protein
MGILDEEWARTRVRSLSRLGIFLQPGAAVANPADRVQGRPMAAESQPGRCTSQDKGLARLSGRAGGRSRQARDGWGRGAVRDAGADVQRYQTKQIRFGLPRGIRLSGRLGRQPVLDGWVEMARCARWDWQVPMLKMVVDACSGGYSVRCRVIWCRTV